MQQDLSFMRKRLIVRTMMPQDAKTYYSQCELENAPKRTKKLEIVLKKMEPSNPNMIFVVEDFNRNYIGNIKCIALGNGVKVNVEILDAKNLLKYGTETVEEFIQICKEEKLFNRLYLNHCDSAIEQYLNDTKSSIKIDVA